MKVDLHCHSHYSDGKHTPEFLLQRARDNEISHLAITDHDCCVAFEQCQHLATDLKLISGVEISCNWNTQEIHIVGLCIDVAHAGLQKLLAFQQAQRRQRMQKMDSQLQALGTCGLWEHLEALPCIAYTRSHAADFLVENGICKTRQRAFKSYLGRNGRIYTEPDWCSLQAAVQTILDAGGIAVLAHPGRYSLSRRKLELLIDAFVSAGGEALEVSYGNIQPEVRQRLSKIATERRLYCSAGSDFHDSDAGWTDLGRFPALDSTAIKNAIWLHPRWHS